MTPEARKDLHARLDHAINTRSRMSRHEIEGYTDLIRAIGRFEVQPRDTSPVRGARTAGVNSGRHNPTVKGVSDRDESQQNKFDGWVPLDAVGAPNHFACTAQDEAGTIHGCTKRGIRVRLQGEGEGWPYRGHALCPFHQGYYVPLGGRVYA